MPLKPSIKIQPAFFRKVASPTVRRALQTSAFLPGSNRGWVQLHFDVQKIIKEKGLLHPKDKVLIAVSGGQDSLCLAKLLKDMAPQWEWSLTIVHCDHKWRADSAANAERVRQIAWDWGIDFVCHSAESAPRGEAAARDWRYSVLQRIAEEKEWHSIALGHTASDRTETLLFNLMRGSGADGLQALNWSRRLSDKVRIVRPLLGVQRSATAKFCRDQKLAVYEDTTNHDMAYARNRIRHQLLPLMEQQFNAQVELNLARTAELLTADVEYLELQARELLEQASPSLHVEAPDTTGSSATAAAGQLPDSCPRICRSVIAAAPLALQRRAVRAFLQRHVGRGVDYAAVEKVLGLLNAHNRTQTDPLAAGWIPAVRGAWIELHRSPSCEKRHKAGGIVKAVASNDTAVNHSTSPPTPKP